MRSKQLRTSDILQNMVTETGNFRLESRICISSFAHTAISIVYLMDKPERLEN